MFRKLVSNLPFNPSLIGELSFYYRRMRREERLRQIGMIFIVLSFVIQSFAFFAPPEPTLAYSDNDIIKGGFQNRDQAVLWCIDPQKDFSQILAYFRVTCDILAGAETTTIKSTDSGKQLDSMGRQQKGSVITRTGKQTDEYQVNVPGVNSPLWMRNLWAFDSGAYSSYRVLKMQNLDGKTIYVMYNCGNIVTIGKYTPEEKTEEPTPEQPQNHKPIASFSASCGGINWLSSDPDGAPRVKIYITVKTNDYNADWTFKGGAAYTIQAPTSGTSNNGTKRIPPIIAENTEDTYRVFVTVSDTKPDGTISDSAAVRAEPVRGVVFGPCSEEEQTPPPTPPTPTVTTDVCLNKPGTQTELSECDVCPDIPEIQYRYSDCDICPNVPDIQTDKNQCYPCPEAQDNNATTACLQLDKTAANLTQNIDDANGTQAKAGDLIVYTLTVENKGDQDVKDFVIDEDMGDVMQYADITDMHGATLDDKKLSWPVMTIPAKEKITKTITVKVKSPIPQTPVSVSDTTAYDLVMTNAFYGSSVNITLPKSVSKTAETITQTLPNTGPGESMVIAIAITVLVSYFMARAYLLRKETQVVKTQFVAGGN